MKQTTAFIVVLHFALSVLAQAPAGMSYQAVVRDASNALLANQAVGMRISLLQGNANGSVVYTETHTPVTNANGLVSIEIGSGAVISGNFDSIVWAAGPYFIKTETDPTGGNNYSLTSTQQLLSVPYALYARSSGSSVPGPQGAQGPAGTNGQDGVSITNTQVNGDSLFISLSNGQTLNAGHVRGAQGNPASDDQHLSVSIIGDTLSIENGGYVIITGISQMQLGMTTGSSISNCGVPCILNPGKFYGTMSDQDGNTYKTIKIGNQVWMAENLKTNHFRDGSIIPTVTNSTNWINLTSSGSCWPFNDSAAYACPYGKLYNGFSCNDSRNICPQGWHVPSENDFNQLITSLDPTYNENNFQSIYAGGQLKSQSSIHWAGAGSNIDANNYSGFSALGGVNRISNGDFFYGDGFSFTVSQVSFWTNSQSDPYNNKTITLYWQSGAISKPTSSLINGHYVRCIKD